MHEIEYCYIFCKRDQEHWYVDQEGNVRHRNRSHKGLMVNVFRLHRLEQDLDIVPKSKAKAKPGVQDENIPLYTV